MILHTQAEVIEIFDANEAGIAPVYDIAQLFADPHVAARRMIVEIDDEELGPTKVPNVVPRFSRTPGEVRHLGPTPGKHTDEVLASLGYTAEEIEALRSAGIV